MATFVHIATESSVTSIRRNGISASRLSNEGAPARGVFCFPVLPDFFATHQWTHELRRRGREKRCGIYFRIADSQLVYVGHYGSEYEEMSAANAVGVLQDRQALGFEVVIPRSVSRSEILRIKTLPQVTGWRVHPQAKGTHPLWPMPGSFGARKLRHRMTNRERQEQLERERYYARFPAEWYAED